MSKYQEMKDFGIEVWEEYQADDRLKEAFPTFELYLQWMSVHCQIRVANRLEDIKGTLELLANLLAHSG